MIITEMPGPGPGSPGPSSRSDSYRTSTSGRGGQSALQQVRQVARPLSVRSPLPPNVSDLEVEKILGCQGNVPQLAMTVQTFDIAQEGGGALLRSLAERGSGPPKQLDPGRLGHGSSLGNFPGRVK